MNKFTLGAVAGVTSLLIAVPILAQVSSAASATTSSTATEQHAFTRPIPTQAEVTAMADHDAAFLKNIDAFVTIQKTALQAHEDALRAAASIVDDTARDAAVKKAHNDMRTTIEAAITANPDLKGAMMFGGRGHGGFGHGPMGAELATKLGMTEAELKAAIDGGKTIEQIATEKGITLPARPMGGMMGHFGRGHGPDNDNDKETNDDDQVAPAATTAPAQN